jgi:phospholipid transport system substrate-binding protein
VKADRTRSAGWIRKHIGNFRESSTRLFLRRCVAACVVITPSISWVARARLASMSGAEARQSFLTKGFPMLRRSLLTTAVVLIAAGFAAEAPAKAGMDPADFINNFGAQLQIATRTTSPEQRVAGFRQLFREDFDVPGLGRFVLGRFWRVLSPPEQQEFLGLFENYVVYTYSDRLSEYAGNGAAPRVTGSRRDADGVTVSSEITRWSGRGQTVQPIRVDWRLTRHEGVYKISDVIIDGLSMALTGRSEFQGVAERNGGKPQAILAVMRQETANAVRR